MQNPSDPNVNVLFNWTEYTLNDSGIWINSTQVDMFSAPYAVSSTGASGTQVTGHLKAGGYDGVFNALRSTGYGGLIQTRADGTIVRALNPGHGIEGGRIPATAMDDYINRVWARYATTALTVRPFSDQPNTVYTGRVSGNVMNFTNSSGAVVTSFQKPDSDSVFGCYKLLDAPNDLVRGSISRTLCAGFNRTTLLTSADQPYNVPSAFYQDAVTNQYAKAVHAQMIDGKAYAFAFDDVGNNESLVHDDSPAGAGIILDPFTGGNGGNPPPSPTPSRTPSASPTPSTSPSCTPGAAQLLSQGRPATASSNESGSSAALAVDGTSPCSGTPSGGPLNPTQLLLADGTLSGTAGPAGTLTVAAANGNHDGTPTNPLTFTASGLTGTYTGGATAFDLAVDSGTGVGNGLQARVSYDLTGDGTYERVETYRYFPTDPVAGWEHYTQAQGLSSATGSLGNLAGGRVKVEIWSAIGGSAGTLGVGNLSRLTLPLN